MKTRKLGWTDLELTAIGFGTWALGGSGWKFAWGAQDDNESIAAIRRGLELGINWVDTAFVYGLGHSEEVVGRAIQGLKPRPIVATKCGRRGKPGGDIHGDLRTASVREECHNSLRRLQVDCIDLYQIHWPDPDGQLEEGWGAIAQLVKEGKIRYAGVSNFSVAQMERVQKIHPVASAQPPYSMLRRDVEADVLPFCKAQRIGVVAYGPMHEGLLTGAFTKERAASLPQDDFRSRNPYFTEPQLSVNLETIARLKELAARQRLTCGQLAIAWVLRREEVTSAIVGARRPAQIEETHKAADVVLAPALLQEIETVLAERKKKLGAK
ncbi:MAG: aldo/keto reductase [Planctomycetota bacterium]